MEEAVVFLLYKDGKILIEHRPEDVFIPNGGVELQDMKEAKDYRIVALLREAKEEMNITLTRYEYLTKYHVDFMDCMFYAYVVTEWEGEIPSHTIEDGTPHARLEWIELKDFREYLTVPTAVHICEKLISSKT